MRGLEFFRCLFGRDLVVGEEVRPRGRARRAVDLVRAFAAAAQGWSAEPAEASDNPQRAALIATSDVGQRRFCETFLRALGLRVEIAQNATQALAAVDADAYGMVIVDAALPGLDGEFWAHLFGTLMSSRLPRSPHLYLVTDDEEARIAAFRHLGAHRQISRPVRAMALVEAIERLGI